MVFEIGKYYKHTTAHYIFVCGIVFTHMHGITLIGESNKRKCKTEYIPLGKDESSAVNYTEINKEEFIEVCYS